MEYFVQLHYSGDVTMRQKQLNYMDLTGIHVDECGVFLSEEYPYLATSPDGGIRLMGVKCPYKHRDHSIADSCKDSAFCLYSDEDGSQQLKRTHDYYYQITGQFVISLYGPIWKYMLREFFQMSCGWKWLEN